MVVGIAEVEVSGNKGLRSVIEEVWAALANSRSSSIVEEKRCIEMRYMGIGYKPLQQRTLKLGVAAWESVVGVGEAQRC